MMFKSLLKVQQTVGAIKKDGFNPFHKSKYASLGAILELLLPALHENGFVLMQPIERDGDTWGVHTWLYWTGDKVSDRIDCGFIPLLECKDPQAQGKAISYNRRYALQTALGLWADDDDAESSCERTPPPKFDDRGARVAPKKAAPVATVAEVQARQEPAQGVKLESSVIPPVAPIPQLASVVAEPPKVDIAAALFDYKSNDHRKLLTISVKAAQVLPAKLSAVREYFESGRWQQDNLTADTNVLIAKIKELAAN